MDANTSPFPLVLKNEPSLQGSPSLRRAVLGLGNLFYIDEGLGVHALFILQVQLSSRPDIEWVDGGVMGLDLLPLVEECSHLLVLDAIDAGLAPGSLVEIRREEIPYYRGIKLSEHQVGFQEVMALANARDRLPKHLTLLGIQPGDLSLGMELSLIASSTLPALLDRAMKILDTW